MRLVIRPSRPWSVVFALTLWAVTAMAWIMVNVILGMFLHSDYGKEPGAPAGNGGPGVVASEVPPASMVSPSAREHVATGPGSRRTARRVSTVRV